MRGRLRSLPTVWHRLSAGDPTGKTYIESWDAGGGGGAGAWVRPPASRYGNPLLWTGQRYDAGVGLYAFPVRTYSPHLGRWLTRDPLGYIDGVNLYEYVGSMPTVYTDPLGLAAHFSGIGGGGEGPGGMKGGRNGQMAPPWWDPPPDWPPWPGGPEVPKPPKPEEVDEETRWVIARYDMQGLFQAYYVDWDEVLRKLYADTWNKIDNRLDSWWEAYLKFLKALDAYNKKVRKKAWREAQKGYGPEFFTGPRAQPRTWAVNPNTLSKGVLGVLGGRDRRGSLESCGN